MAIHYRRIADYLRSALAGRGLDELARLRPRRDPSRPRVPGGSALTDDAVAARLIDGRDPRNAEEIADRARCVASVLAGRQPVRTPRGRRPRAGKVKEAS